MNNFARFKPFSSNVASLWLFYRYFHGHYSKDLHSLFPPVQTFTTATDHTIYTGANHPHRLFVRRKWQSDGFFPTAVTVWIRHTRQCFRNQYTRVLSVVDIHIIYNCYLHKSNQFSNTPLSVTLEWYVVIKSNLRKSPLIDILWMNRRISEKKFEFFFFFQINMLKYTVLLSGDAGENISFL